MEARRGVRFGVAGWLVSASILFGLMSGAAHGEELYTRTDWALCGDTLVQAFTTCAADSHDLDAPVCTEQHFLFVNKKTGASIRLQGPGKPVVDRQVEGVKIGARYDGLATKWACLYGRKGSYMGFMLDSWPGRGNTSWDEIFDLKGRRVASNKGRGDKADKAFDRTWRSLHLPPSFFVAPWDVIELFRTDREDAGIWRGYSHEPLNR